MRHFSGKATYTKNVQIPAALLGRGRVLFLDLGAVEVMARVKLNGKELGILWKKPFRIDITKAARAGSNALELTVVNLGPNRLIGDANLPEDCEWSGGDAPAKRPEEKSLPEWAMVEAQARPRGTTGVPEIRSLTDSLREELPEFRRAQALGYPLAGMISLIVMAMATGARQGPDDLAQFADTLSQPQLRALGFRRDAGTLGLRKNLTGRDVLGILVIDLPC